MFFVSVVRHGAGLHAALPILHIGEVDARLLLALRDAVGILPGAGRGGYSRRSGPGTRKSNARKLRKGMVKVVGLLAIPPGAAGHRATPWHCGAGTAWCAAPRLDMAGDGRLAPGPHEAQLCRGSRHASGRARRGMGGHCCHGGNSDGHPSVIIFIPARCIVRSPATTPALPTLRRAPPLTTQNQVAIVTGSSRGIGAAIAAQRLARDGSTSLSSTTPAARRKRKTGRPDR